MSADVLQSSAVRAAVVFGAAVLLALNYLFADLGRIEQTARLDLRTEHEAAALPPPDLIRGALLNFDTLGADLVWIHTVLYFGHQRSRRHHPARLDEYASTIADLDPYFFPVYRWFSHSYLSTRYPPPPEALARVNDFLERGMKRFPADYRLPKTAGLNYIGYPTDTRSTRQRLREIDRAIDYLEKASKFEDAPESLALTVANLYQRQRQLRTTLRGDVTGGTRAEGLTGKQVDFFVDMYFTVDSGDTREEIRRILDRTEGGRRALLERGRRYDDHLERERSRRSSYLPLGLWTMVVRPQ